MPNAIGVSNVEHECIRKHVVVGMTIEGRLQGYSCLMEEVNEYFNN